MRAVVKTLDQTLRLRVIGSGGGVINVKVRA